jgi:anti-anti-sigma factor
VQVSVSSEHDGTVLTVAVSGDIDLSTRLTVESAIDGALAEPGVAAVQVDLSGVEFLDSSGIALLLRGRRSADDRAVAFRVTGAHGIAQRVLELTGVWAHLCGDADQTRPTAP